MKWDILASIILIVSVITTPIDIAFPSYSENIFEYSIFLYIIDILFLIDIIVTFNSAYENDIYDIVDD